MTAAPGSPKPRRHRYRLDAIVRLLALVLLADVALRAAARALPLAGGSAPASLAAPAPHHATGRLWLLRLGLHRLRRRVRPADDWCWLVDHTALLGRQRLLVVLGFRLAGWAKRAAKGKGTLRFADVRVLLVAAVEDPDAAKVLAHLEALAGRAGAPRCIVSDRGADVLAGIRLFREAHPETAEVCDSKHFAANRLKGLLQGAPSWQAFQGRRGKAKAALQQTEWAFVVPPALRTKSRWLNLDVLLGWAAKARALLALPEAERAKRGDPERLEKALGWLRGMDADLEAWGERLAVSEATVRAARQGGLHAGASAALAGELSGLARTEEGKGLAARLAGFVAEQQAQAKEGERLACSPEVLESLFGRFKALAKDHMRGGITSLALALPALLGAPDERETERALADCPVADVRRWVKKNLSPNVQQARCWLRSLLPDKPRKKKRAKRQKARK